MNQNRIDVRSPPALMVFLLLWAAFEQHTPASAVGCSAPSFAAARAFSAGQRPAFVATDDLNGDGKPDLTVVNSIAGTLSVLLAEGEGAFRPAVAYATSARVLPDPIAVAVGDFNADGTVDLAVGNRGTSRASVLLGLGDGTFGPAVEYASASVSDGGPASIAVEDFDNDGKADLAVLNHNISKLSVLRGIGDGKFKPALDSEAGAVGARGPIGMTVGDFNRDGKPDVAVVNHHDHKLSVLLGKGDATFRAAVGYPAAAQASSGPVALTTGDFNGDGKPDLAVASTEIDKVSVLLGRGDGTFRSAVDYPAGPGAGAYPVSVAAGDFNGDGKLDLAVLNQNINAVSVLLGKGTGAFETPVDFAVGSNPQWVAISDFDGDGQADFVTADQDSGTASVLLNTCGYGGVGLAVERSGAGITVSWPLPSSGYVLESTPGLSLPDWQPAVETSVTNNGRLEIALPADGLQRYFRLRRP